jgi:hypothetical protein
MKVLILVDKFGNLLLKTIGTKDIPLRVIFTFATYNIPQHSIFVFLQPKPVLSLLDRCGKNTYLRVGSSITTKI